MKLPKTVKVSHYKIPVEYTDCLEYQGRACYGIFDSKNMAIYLDSEISEQHIRDTLLHEVLHAIYFAYNIDVLDGEQEHVVTLIATAMIQLIDDNPKLMAFLQC